jgi:hypothetical protein
VLERLAERADALETELHPEPLEAEEEFQGVGRAQVTPPAPPLSGRAPAGPRRRTEEPA